MSRDISDPDESTLLLGFSSPFTAPESYLRPEVKIEMGARSDTWPSETITIRTMVSEGLPDMVENTEVLVRALSPQRTFWEKALLLHEEHFRPEEKRRKARMARHYYDMWCLIRAGIADQAASDSHLFASVVEHRKVFFRQKWVNYEAMQRGKLRILPAAEQEEQWKKDYEAMRSYLLPGDQPPTWEEIVRVVGQFEEGFNS